MKNTDLQYSLQQVMELVGNDKEMLLTLLQLFIANSTTSLNEISKALTENDLQNVKKHAHKIRPSCKIFGMYKIAEDFATIEALSEEKKNTIKIIEMYNEINTKMLQIICELKEYIKTI